MIGLTGGSFCGLVCLCCVTLLPGHPTGEQPSPAAQLWQKGQDAIRHGDAGEAIRCYEQSLRLDPAMSSNHLSLAAAYLEKKNTAEACSHLGRYLALNPEQRALRSSYAELLARLHRFPEACAQYERCIADAQGEGAATLEDQIHCHSRLVDFAETAEDAYTEHLHRGIALLLLAQKRVQLPEPDGDLPAESLLCKAAAELTLARIERPQEARPSWYLHEVWSHLGQRQPALCRLREAKDAAPFTYLTPAEQSDLLVACQRSLTGAHP
jgi:tetratricopeptide (TPR) repeat protein